MLINTLLIVADRGGLRAFKVTENPNRAPGLHLLDDLETLDARGHYNDKVSDQAGRFKGSGINGQSTGGASDHSHIDMENDRRACKHVAERINELVAKEKPEGWLLAIPSTIHHLVESHLKKEVAGKITQVVHADLRRTEPAKIAGHFSALQAA